MLTETKLKSLKPRERAYRVADQAGLSAEVSPAGTISWVFRYRLNGKQQAVRLGRYPEVSLAQAREKRFEARKLIAQEKSPAEEKKARKAGISARSTVAEFEARFMEDQVSKARKEPKAIERYFANHILPAIGRKPLPDVTPLDVLQITDAIKGAGSPMAALAVYKLLKRFFAYAVARQQIVFNPASAIPSRAIATPRARERVLTSAEIRTYLTTLYRSDLARRYKLALHLILITLVRKAELVLARWSDVDLINAEWRIPAENSKTGKPRVVYLSTHAIETFMELKSLAGNREYVLSGRNKPNQPICKSLLNSALKAIDFGIPHFTIHDSRFPTHGVYASERNGLA